MSWITLVGRLKLGFDLKFYLAEWVEARISISSARSQELQSVILGRFGLQSIKEPANGYLVPIPSLNDSRRKFSSATPSDSVGDGCDTFKNFKILSWRPRSKRKRGKFQLKTYHQVNF